MNTRTYRKAKRYAYKLKHRDSLDLVHDAYLAWHSKTGKDLFDEPVGRVFTVIRLTFMTFLKKNKHQQGGGSKRGSATRKYITPLEKGRRQYFEFDGHLVNHITPEDEYIALEKSRLYDRIVESVPPARACFNGNEYIVRDLLRLKKKGYKNYEIAETLGVDRSLITYYFKQVDLGIILN